MFRNSRRFWPLWLACGCWLLILLVPPTRRGVEAAWSNRFGNAMRDADEPTPEDFASEIRAWTQRFPGDKRVELYAADHFNGAADLVKRYPDDVTFIALALRQQMRSLRSDRYEGPLTNSNFPTPPRKPNRSFLSSRAEWNRFLALAARGRELEPNNSYFCWMRLYGLLGTRQDDLARAELARAARLSAYDDHAREVALNYLSVTRLAFGSPLSPRDWGGLSTTNFFELTRFQQTSRWIMETVIADRQIGRHPRALNTAWHLVQLARVMRRESYTLFQSNGAIRCQEIAFRDVQVRPRRRGLATPRIGGALGSFQNDPRMLYFYARSQRRRDITRLLDSEWVEVGKWQRQVRTGIDSLVAAGRSPQINTLIAADRFALLCVRAMPSILVAGVFFALIASRFRADVGAREVFWRGAGVGAALLLMAMICDALIVYQSDDALGLLTLSDLYFGSTGLFEYLEWWVHFGLAGAVICFGLNRAVAWQKARSGRQIPLKSRLKTLLSAPEDGLTRFDFGWLFGLVARTTGWALLVGGALGFCANADAMYTATEDRFPIDPGVVALGGALFIPVLLSILTWRKLPRRRETLRAAPRFIAGALGGLFVTLSVLYTLVAFAVLPIAWQNEAEFEREMKVGQLAMARAQIGF